MDIITVSNKDQDPGQSLVGRYVIFLKIEEVVDFPRNCEGHVKRRKSDMPANISYFRAGFQYTDKLLSNSSASIILQAIMMEFSS